MYSALKRDGQPLYKLARQGIEVEREARTVTIRRLHLLAVQDEEARLAVTCSKGTYVRTLAEDLARAMGSCAHLSALRRTAVAPFPANALVTLEELEANPAGVPLLPADAALPQLAELRLEADAARRMGQGQALRLAGTAASVAGLVRLYTPGGTFLGIGQQDPIEGGGVLIKPVRLFNDLAPSAT
jgi:tRNA pseudouridine55 synthase